jgi:dipeptidyl aminopeptidase/acylaminoacyl peptidase
MNHCADGTILEIGVRQPVFMHSHAHYIQTCVQRREQEVSAARHEGFELETPAYFCTRLPQPSHYENMIAYARFECLRFVYSSGGYRVVGFIWKPKDVSGSARFPVVVFNRGGNRELGKLTPEYRFGFQHFLSAGFVVVATQYRGSDGGEGKDELGGADVHDVLNLLPLATSLPYINTDNVFMLGESRGGMMAYLALKHGMAVNAVAVIGGMADLIADAQVRPKLLDVAHRQLIPDFDRDPEAHMRERSAVFWPEKLNAPLLLMHGGSDWRCDPASQTLPLALKLQQLKKTYELVIYAEDDHTLSLNREDSDRRIVEWFRRFMK